MSWIERIRQLSRLAPTTALLTAIACGGGGDKSPTGPGDPAADNTVQFQLVSLGLAGLPADAELEDCKLTRFYGGKIDINPTTGDWQIKLQVHDDSGDWGYLDKGGSEGNGTTVLFDSQVSGITYQGTVNANGTEVTIMYDWCANGVPDVQLVFDR
jgi:hypothetical protein